MPPKTTTDGSAAGAAPRRGKFLSAPPPAAAVSSSSPSITSKAASPPKSRGKFLGQSSSTTATSATTAAASTNASLSSANNAAVSTATIQDENSLSTLKSQIQQAKMVASTRRKVISSSRNQLFQDLEEAENIVLALLHCASEVSDSLSSMTTAKSRHHQQQQQKSEEDDEGDEEQSKTNNNNKTTTQLTFEELSAQVRSNGIGYLAGVTKLHELLKPHASLVKAYRHHHHHHTAAISGAGVDDTKGQQQQQQVQQQSSSDIATLTGSNSELVKMVTSNMSAARVEQRLAIERRDILREMIRLEELEKDGEGVGVDDGEKSEEDLKSKKRKR
ncbi:hypothetical protein ACHAWC_004228 [Mediolabrus comicus]